MVLRLQVICLEEKYIIRINFDILFWYVENSQVVNYSERNFERKQDLKYFKNLNKHTFNEVDYPIPSHIEDWLVLRYGNDWNIPKTSKGDWKEECFDIFNLAD